MPLNEPMLEASFTGIGTFQAINACIECRDSTFGVHIAQEYSRENVRK